MTTPAAVDYTSRDYAAFRDSMLTYAGVVCPEWRGAQDGGDPNDFGVVLLELFAYEGDVLSYYGDRIANESFLTTATQRASVLAHAALLDYTPRSATPATVTLTVTVSSAADVVLPAGFKVSTTSDGDNLPITFETDTDLVVTSTGDPVAVQVTATEGLTVTDEIVATSCGDLDSEFTLAQQPVVATSLRVRVVEQPASPGQVWNQVNSLLDAGPTDYVYSITLDANDALTLHFGDGVNGRVPPRGAVVHADYRVGGGADGNVLSNTVTNVVDPTDVVYPVEPATPVAPPFIQITNPSAATGGTDSESLESIRVNAPRALRTRERAVSLEDYATLALTVPQVQIAKARAVAAVYTNVTVYVAPAGGGVPDQATLNAVVAYFGPRKLANVTVVAATPAYVSIDVALNVVVDPRYSQVTVKQAVRNALQEFLAFDNVDFGGRVSLAAVYGIASRVEGVINVTVSTLARQGGSAATDVVLKENELPISGAFQLTATGGVVNTASGGDETVGDETQFPEPSAAADLQLAVFRCDPNSTHAELGWTPGTDTTYYDVVVSYLNTDDEVVSSTVLGPFGLPRATIDLPLIGHGRADEIALVVRSYNDTRGPVDSVPLRVPYTCEV